MMQIFNNLCMPSKLYLIIGVILLAISLYYDMNTKDSAKMCLGNVNCKIKNKPAYYFLNLMFILFWSWMLNTLCRYGWTKMSWVIFLFPYIIMIVAFILITTMVIKLSKQLK